MLRKMTWDERVLAIERARSAGYFLKEIAVAIGCKPDNLRALIIRRGKYSPFLVVLDRWLDEYEKEGLAHCIPRANAHSPSASQPQTPAQKDRESAAWVSFASAGLSADSTVDMDTGERFPRSCRQSAGSADLMLEEWKKRRDRHEW